MMPVWLLPIGFVESSLDDLAVAHLVEDPLVRRHGAELGIVLGKVTEAARQI